MTLSDDTVNSFIASSFPACISHTLPGCYSHLEGLDSSHLIWLVKKESCGPTLMAKGSNSTLSCHHFLDCTWYSYEIRFNHTKRLSSRKDYVFMTQEGKGKAKERKWERSKRSCHPQNFADLHSRAHTHILAHTHLHTHRVHQDCRFFQVWVKLAATTLPSLLPLKPPKLQSYLSPSPWLIIHSAIQTILSCDTGSILNIAQGHICSENGLLRW